MVLEPADDRLTVTGLACLVLVRRSFTEASVLIYDGVKSPRYDCEPVNGGKRIYMEWPQPDLRRAWLDSERRVAYAHQLTAGCFGLRLDGVPNTLSKVLHVLAGIEDALKSSSPKTHKISQQLEVALWCWPVSLHTPPEQPSARPLCLCGCGHPASDGRRKREACVKRETRARKRAKRNIS